MRQLPLVALALVPLWSAAQAPAAPAPAAVQASPPAPAQPTPGPQPIAIEPAAGPSSPQPVAVAAAPAGAERSYLFARLGTIVPRSSDMKGFDNGIAVEAGAGTRLTRYLAVEVGTGYLRASLDEMRPSDAGPYRMEQDLTAVPIVATARLATHTRGFEAYALAGAGLYLWSLSGTMTATAVESFSDTSTTFGAHLGAGVSASLSPRFTLGLEAKYLFAKATLFDRTSELGSAIVTASFGYAF